jgi:hypothetical protein
MNHAENFLRSVLALDGHAFKHASDRIKFDLDFVYEAIAIAPWSIKYIHHTHPKYDDLVHEALKFEPDTLSSVIRRMQDDYYSVMIAVKGKGDAIRFASDRLIDNESLGIEAIKQSPSSFLVLSKRLQLLPEIQKYSGINLNNVVSIFG